MRLIVGLGNPESRYRGTRHNIGAAAVRECAGTHAAPLKKGLFSSSSCARVRIESCESLFAVPLSYMNLSGPPVAALARKHRIAAEDILVVHDDLDLEFGKMKLRLGGSAGGHNGLKSVIGSLGSPEFCRLRIGIGRPPQGMDPADYVLSRFDRQEQGQLEEIIASACSAMDLWAAEGISKTMNMFNR